jgi:hypothetical protein
MTRISRGHLAMPIRAKRVSPALKHGAYSETALRPGEDPADFKKLHRGLIAEFAPNGRMEEETVASIARLLWRRQNLAMFEIGQLSHFMAESLEKAAAKKSTNSKEDAAKKSTNSKEDEELISELEKLIEANVRAHKAEGGDREEEALAELGEIAKVATLNRLMKELDLEERLDAMIDRLIKRLLFVRGLKSITSSAATVPPATAQKGLRRIRAV